MGELGVERGQVRVVEYDPRWEADFETECKRIADLIGITAIEHIGGTSVPKLASKPIIDIMVGISTLEDGRKYVDALGTLGYEYKGHNRIAQRHYFSKWKSPGNPTITHHIHMVVEGDVLWTNHLLFRDFLRDHDDYREAYAALKWRLAEEYPNDREAYTQKKDLFIKHLLRLARQST